MARLPTAGTTEDRDRGFTLIELMVVVLIIAILLAIAIPTFLGAREAAWDRAAQSNVRNAHTAEMIHYADRRIFTSNPTVLTSIEPSLNYEATALVALTTNAHVYVETATTTRVNDTVFIGGRSGSGRCYWLRTVGDQNEPRFASNNCSGVPGTAAFTDEW